MVLAICVLRGSLYPGWFCPIVHAERHPARNPGLFIDFRVKPRGQVPMHRILGSMRIEREALQHLLFVEPHHRNRLINFGGSKHTVVSVYHRPALR